ncbi:MAG: hypothetical protein HFE94_03555 [Acutalibacter sp.]|nr:hypothetical protein [Acutalibacter sp.]
MFQLRCINIVSPAPEELVKFYETVFEATANQLVPSRWELPAGGVTLVFTHTSEKAVVPADSCGLEFEVEDVDAQYSRLTTAGLRPSAPPVTYPWGWRAFGIKAPEGNHLDFVQYVGQE